MDKPEIKYDNLLDYFNFYLFPIALKIGMTPEQFWEDNPQYFYAYWDAYSEKKKEMAEYDNVYAFNQAKYFLLALQQCLQFSKNPRAIFPKKPFEMKTKIKKQITQEEYQEIRKLQLKESVKRFNKK